MPQKRDLRVQKTYTALFRAFETLLTKKRFEDITVTELCDAAVIRTATFYKHFPDKYAFVAFMVQELRAQYYESAAKLQTDTREDFYLNLIRAGFDFLAENESLVKAADSDGMMNIIASTTGDSLRQALVANLNQDRHPSDAVCRIITPRMPVSAAPVQFGPSPPASVGRHPLPIAAAYSTARRGRSGTYSKFLWAVLRSAG